MSSSSPDAGELPPVGPFPALMWRALVEQSKLRREKAKGGSATHSAGAKRKAPMTSGPPAAPTRASTRTATVNAVASSANAAKMQKLGPHPSRPLPPPSFPLAPLSPRTSALLRQMQPAPRLRKGQRVMTPSLLLSRQPLPFDLGRPSVALNQVKSDQQMRDWIREAVTTWDTLADARRAKPGHQPSRWIVSNTPHPPVRKQANSSKNAARDRRRQAEKEAAQKKAHEQHQQQLLRQQQHQQQQQHAQQQLQLQAAQRKPSVVVPRPPQEDSSLPSFASSPALPSSDVLLRLCPPAFVSSVLRAFDFLHLYAEPLSFSLSPHTFSLSLFLSALLTPPSPVENYAINLVMAALVRMVIRTSPPLPTSPLTPRQKSVQNFLIGSAPNPGDTEDVGEGVVCNAVTWQRRLRDWLVEDSLLRTVKKRQRNELRTLAAFLCIDTFYQLPLQQRLFLLNLLTVGAVRSPTMRAFFHNAVETLENMRKQALVSRNAQIHTIRESEATLPDVAVRLTEMVDSVVGVKKKEREPGHTVHSLVRLGRAHLRAESDRSAAEWDAKVDEAQRKWQLRTVSVGVDRHHNRYFIMGGQKSILLISHSDDYAKRYQPLPPPPPLPQPQAKQEEDGAKEEKGEDAGAAPMEVDEKDAAEMKEGRKEKVKADAAYTRWSYVASKEQLDALLGWLNPAGIRDKALKEALLKLQLAPHMPDTEQPPLQPPPFEIIITPPLPQRAVKVQDSQVKQEQTAIDTQPPPAAVVEDDPNSLTLAPSATPATPSSPSSSPSPPPSSSEPAYHPLLRYDYRQVNEWNRSSLRAWLILTAEDKTGSMQYVRCPLCQEAVDQKVEGHCPTCHFTMTLIPPKTEADFLAAHECPGQPPADRDWKAGGIFVADAREEGRERDEVTVDLDVKVKPLVKGRRKMDSESDSDSEEDEEPDDDERDDERRVRFAVKEEDEEKKAADMQDGEDQPAPPDDSVPSSSLSATPPPPKKPKVAVVTRLTPRPTSLQSASSNFQLLKACVLDIEAAIPVEAVKVYTSTAARMVWVEHVKLTCRLRVMGRGLSELGRNLKVAWIRPWFRVDDWLRRCWEVDSEADLAACLFEFDRALIYSNDEKDAEAEAVSSQSRVEEEEKEKVVQSRAGQTATPEVEDEDDGLEVCRICKSGEDPDSLLLCDHCDREYHMDCLQPPLRSVPKGKWFCPTCKKKGMKMLTGKAVAKQSTSQKGKAGGSAGGSKKGGKSGERKRGSAAVLDDTLVQVPAHEQQLPADYGICKKCHLNEGDPLLCDRCDDAYHLACLDPPLDAVPEGDWFCEPCKAEMREEEEAKRKAQTHKEQEDEDYQQPEAGAQEDGGYGEAADQEAEDADEVDGAGGGEDDEQPNASRKPQRRARVKESDTENEDDEPGAPPTAGNGHAAADDDGEDEEDDDDEQEFAPGDNDGAVAAKPANGRASSRTATASDSEQSAVSSEDVCSVCFSPDSRDDNLIVFCDGCNLPVHQQCQGLEEVPEGDFFCDRCAAKLPPDSTAFPCVLCGLHLPAGAMKQVEEGRRAGEWVHISCMVFYPDVGWSDVVARRGVQGVDEVDPELLGHRCDACKATQGAMLRCDAPQCGAWMHVPCALANKDYTMSWNIDHGQPIVFCKRHTAQ